MDDIETAKNLTVKARTAYSVWDVCTSVFCVYGQLGILLDNNLDQSEKAKKIRAFLIYALRL